MEGRSPSKIISFCAALRDALFTRTLQAYVEVPHSTKWLALKTLPLAEVGFAETDALIDFPARSHPAYRLLTEYSRQQELAGKAFVLRDFMDVFNREGMIPVPLMEAELIQEAARDH